MMVFGDSTGFSRDNRGNLESNLYFHFKSERNEEYTMTDDLGMAILCAMV